MPCDSGPTAALLLLRSLGVHVHHTPTLCLLFTARVSGVRASLYPHQREDSPVEAQEHEWSGSSEGTRHGPPLWCQGSGEHPWKSHGECFSPSSLWPSRSASPCLLLFPDFSLLPRVSTLFCFSPKWLDTVVETWKGEKLCG